MTNSIDNLPIKVLHLEAIKAARQLVIVQADSWSSITGQLWALEQKDEQWTPVVAPLPVTLGKNGLTYGNGLVEWHAPDTKREGDWKTPVGAYTLSGAYGYATAADAEWVQLPYLAATPQHKAVDDPNSRYYNQIVREDLVADKDWTSAEEMVRQDHLYKWGVIVDFNRKNIVPGGGSCIYMHLWREANRYTAGCTAMAEEDMGFLLRWLRPVPKPVLVQGDKGTLQELLPALSLEKVIDILPD